MSRTFSRVLNWYHQGLRTAGEPSKVCGELKIDQPGSDNLKTLMLGFEASVRSRVEFRVASGYGALGWVVRVPMSASTCSVCRKQRYYMLQCRPKASSYP